jgi:spoIIIJ-associated protein
LTQPRFVVHDCAMLPSPREALEMLLGHLGFVFEVEEIRTEEGLVLNVKTREPGRLIGREGHTLDDLQLLVNRLSHHDEDEGRVIVDVDGYRQAQRQELISRVKRAARRVRETGQPVLLEPMNSFERRLVHQLFKDDPKVMSVSPQGRARIKRIELRPKDATS